MEVPLELTFKNVNKTAGLEDLIREKAAKLEEVCDSLISCHVIVEKPQHYQQSGNPYRVRIRMHVPPGHELVVKREPGEGDMHDPLDAVIREAFDAAWTQLQKQMRKIRGDVKKHPDQEVMGFVVRLFPEEGYGFLRTVTGRELYFHRNSVLHHGFDRLAVGTGVRFVMEEGRKGPQASTVEIVDKPGAHEGGSLGELPPVET